MGMQARLMGLLRWWVALALIVPAQARAFEHGAAVSGDFADPFVALDGDQYYAFATAGQGKHVQVARSRDLQSWMALPDALPNLPGWISPEDGMEFTWAPSVLKRADAWVLYYTARERSSGFQCISRAIAAHPEGPYRDDSSSPFVCQTALCGSIDPSPFVDTTGKPWLLWKSDENSSRCAAPTRIWSQALSEDGLDLKKSPTALLVANLDWERALIEGPSMVRHGSSTYLFYSANRYEGSNYAVGFATCAGPQGPCTKMNGSAPLMKSAGTLLGPGGQEFFTDTSGDMWMAFHAWTAPFSSYKAGGMRSLHLARILFGDKGPQLGH
jgi:beta-xylosidase